MDVTVGGNFSIGGIAGGGYGAGLLTFSGAIDLGGAGGHSPSTVPVTLAGAVSNGGITKSGNQTRVALSAPIHYTVRTLFSAAPCNWAMAERWQSGRCRVRLRSGQTELFQFNRTNADTDFPNSFSERGSFERALAAGASSV